MASKDAATDQEQSFMEHLIELRSRLLKALLSVFLVLLVLLPFSQRLYALLAAPLMARLPVGSNMIAIEVASPFLTPFKFSLVLAFILAIPMVFYQLWSFVAPALYRNEQRLAKPLLYSWMVLFYCGCLFAYFVVFPVMFGFFTSMAPEGVAVMTDISRYLDFVMTMFIAFGVTFEVPIATIILVSAGIITVDKLAEMRSYVIVGAFTVGMFLTPPDVFSQTLVAVPMCLLFELGLIMCRLLLPKRVHGEESDQASN